MPSPWGSPEIRQKQSLPLADFCDSKKKQGEALKMRQKLSLPLGGKVPSESEANEGRD